jgi:hypothetical protein
MSPYGIWFGGRDNDCTIWVMAFWVAGKKTVWENLIPALLCFLPEGAHVSSTNSSLFATKKYNGPMNGPTIRQGSVIFLYF